MGLLIFVFSSHLPLNFSYSVDTTFFLSLRGGGDFFPCFIDLLGVFFSNSGPDAGCNWRGTTSGASNVLVQMGRRKDDPCKPGGSQLKEPISSVMKKPVEPSYR